MARAIIVIILSGAACFASSPQDIDIFGRYSYLPLRAPYVPDFTVKNSFFRALSASFCLLCGCMLNLSSSLPPQKSGEWHAPQAALESAAAPPQIPVSGSDKPEELGLTHLLDEALSNNPELQSSWFQAKAAAARRVQAYSTYFPALTVAENLQRQRVDAVGIPDSTSQGAVMPDMNIVTTRNSYGPLYEISYTIFSFGADSSEAAAAREALYAANFHYNRALQSLVRYVQQGYYNLNAALEGVAAREISLKDAETSYLAAEARNKAGLNPVQDLLKADSNRLQARYQLEASKAVVERTRADLARIIGRGTPEGLAVKPLELPANTAKAAGEVHDLIEKALSRPDLQAAYAVVRAKKQLKSAAGGSLLPRLVTSFSGDFTKVTDEPSIEENYLAMLRLKWDIFDGFRKEYKLTEARANLEAAKQEAKSKELAVVGEVWTAYYDFQSAKLKLDAARALAKAAQSAFAAIETGYKNGLNNILDLLSAQQELANARLILVQSESDFHTTLAELLYAVGELPEPQKAGSKAGADLIASTDSENKHESRQ